MTYQRNAYTSELEKEFKLLSILEGVEISETLTLFPITKDLGHLYISNLLTLEEASSLKEFKIAETGDVNKVKIINKSGQDVLLLNGEIFEGAKQNRTLNDSTLLPGQGEFMMDVSCVEQNRWSSTYGKFNYSNDLHNFRAKGNKMFYVNESKINTGRKRSNQSEVWKDIQEKQRNLNVSSNTSSINDTYRSANSKLEQLNLKIEQVKDQVGFIFYLKNTCLGIEFFNSPSLFSKYSKKLTRSILIDAIELETSRDPFLKYQTSFNEREIKDKFVTLIKGLKEKVIPGPYEGREVVLNYPDLDISLGAITKEDSIIHLSGYQRLRR